MRRRRGRGGGLRTRLVLREVNCCRDACCAVGSRLSTLARKIGIWNIVGQQAYKRQHHEWAVSHPPLVKKLFKSSINKNEREAAGRMTSFVRISRRDEKHSAHTGADDFLRRFPCIEPRPSRIEQIELSIYFSRSFFFLFYRFAWLWWQLMTALFFIPRRNHKMLSRHHCTTAYGANNDMTPHHWFRKLNINISNVNNRQRQIRLTPPKSNRQASMFFHKFEHAFFTLFGKSNWKKASTSVRHHLWIPPMWRSFIFAFSSLTFHTDFFSILISGTNALLLAGQK